MGRMKNTTAPDPKIGERLKYVRTKCFRMTQTDLAQAISEEMGKDPDHPISIQTIRNWETGRTPVPEQVKSILSERLIAKGLASFDQSWFDCGITNEGSTVDARIFDQEGFGKSIRDNMQLIQYLENNLDISVLDLNEKIGDKETEDFFNEIDGYIKFLYNHKMRKEEEND